MRPCLKTQNKQLNNCFNTQKGTNFIFVAFLPTDGPIQAHSREERTLTTKFTEVVYAFPQNCTEMSQVE